MLCICCAGLELCTDHNSHSNDEVTKHRSNAAVYAVAINAVRPTVK